MAGQGESGVNDQSAGNHQKGERPERRKRQPAAADGEGQHELRRPISAGWRRQESPHDQNEDDGFCLDAELLPWSAKAIVLVKSQYAAVGAAASASLSDAVQALAAASERIPEAQPLLDPPIASWT
jgi:hypothetical protein